MSSKIGAAVDGPSEMSAKLRSQIPAVVEITHRFSRVCIGLAQYRDRTDLAAEHKSALAEIMWRIEELQHLYAELVEVNDALAARVLPKIRFDETTEEQVIFAADGTEMMRMKLNRADPNVPIKHRSQAMIGSYNVGSTTGSYNTAGVPALRRQLERDLESYYYSAFRVQKHVSRLPGNKKFPYSGITLVRNKLMEHKSEQSPDEKHPYNFGFGTGGPYVRPAKSADQKEMHTDTGLVANTLEFLAELERRFPAQQSAAADRGDEAAPAER
jgi:hypothetical protein